MLLDRVTGRPALMEGKGIPWIPGYANSLTGADLGLRTDVAGLEVPVEVVGAKAMEFIQAYPNLFGVDTKQVVVDLQGSGPVLDHLYFLNLLVIHKGIPVEGAAIIFRLNSGNMVQAGQSLIEPAALRSLDTIPTLNLEAAQNIMWSFVGGQGPKDVLLDNGSLRIVPISRDAVLSGQLVAPGAGLDYRLVYAFSFHREGVMGNWEARVDAHTGELLSFLDLNRYGSIKGGTYKTDQPASEVSVPFPYADYGASSWSDQGGLFTGTTGTSTMTGRTGSAGNVGSVDIVDSCGAISLASDASGLINFGTSAATDCSSPGGGAGNTRASRTQYYNVAMIKIKAYTYLSGVSTPATWLQGRLTDNVNLNQTCNAYWSPTVGTVNFFRRGSGDCWNTGELPGVSLHEWAHGLDTYDGSPYASDRGTGETYGDFSGILQTHGHCAGNGFFYTWNMGCGTAAVGYNCGGYGDCCNDCSGIRVADYAKHASGKPHFAEDLTSNTCTGCTSYTCSTSSTYAGPCGREGHCESLISTEAMYDLPVRDLVAWGMDTDSAWQLMDKFWYASRPTTGKAYACPSVTTTNGCSAENYFNAFRVVDDCDGDLSNGTPHASAIFAAFNRHKIACATVVNTDNDCGCADLATPVLSGAGGNNNAVLSWGAVAGATGYDVYRNDADCSAGYAKVGSTTSTSFTDSTVVNGVTYYYRIQAKGTGSCPPSPMSNCVTVIPSPCTTPGTPLIGTVTVPGLNQLRVTWTAGSPAGATYRIYRAVLAGSTSDCATGTYSLLASGVTASPYTDNTVSGTVTYGYRVTAMDSTGGCESLPSGCAKATATGSCLMAPSFAGLASVTNPASATCTLNLAWSAGTSNCAGSVTYNVYRSTTSGFTPGVANRIAAGVTGTTCSDSGTLVNGTTYYYVVRAVDTANAVEDTNLIQQSGAPTGPVSSSTMTELFEAAGGFDNAGWTHLYLSGSVDWAWSTAQSQSTSHSWFAAEQTTVSDKILVSPSFGVLSNTTVTFYHRFAFEGTTTTCYDAGTLEYALAPDFTTWTVVPDAYFTANGFNGTVSSSYSNPLGGKRAWCGDLTTWTQVTVNLSGLNGQVIKLRWHEGDDSSTGDTGWYVDTVVFNNAGTASTCSTSGTCTAPGAPNLTGATGACSGINLTWTAGTGTTLAYNIYRGTAAGGPYTKLAGMPVTGTTYSDTTAVAGTTYYYVVRGTCDAGGVTESAASNERSAVRLATPTAPTGVTATPGCTGNSIAWNTVTGATSYNVLRGTACGTVLNTLTGVTSPYNDTTAVAGTTYNYWVVAINSCGTSANSSCATAARLAAPAAPAGPTYTNLSCTTLTVNWAAVSGATQYDLYRRTGACGTGSVIASNLGVTTYNDTGLTASTQYSYYVVAKNTCGSSAAGTCTSTTSTAAPAAPAGLTATGTCTAVDLAWSTSTGATSYEVWRTTNSNCTNGAVLIGSPAGTTYSDGTAVEGTPYYYTVKAVNACGTSAISNCANAARLASPAAPTGVAAAGSCTEVSVSWNTVSGATSYNVVRGTACGTALNTFTGVTSPYNDTTAVAGTTYSYWVVAVNACGDSANSSCAAGTRLVSPTPTITGANANTCPSETVGLTTESGQNGYQWYLGGSPIGGATASAYTATASGSYTVSYSNPSGCSGTSAAHGVTIVACAPNIVYSAHGPLTEITGNGDAYYDLGEKWSVAVTLANTGNIAATTVTATLAGNGIAVCDPIQPYGNIGVGGTASATFEFVISDTFAPCGGSIGFDVTTKTCSELVPAGVDEMDVFSLTVGGGSGSGTTILFGADDDPFNSGNWTLSGSALSEVHCGHTDSYFRSNRDQYMTLNGGLVSTVGHTNIHVIFDRLFNNCETGDVLTLEYYNGSAWVNAATIDYDDRNWHCGEDVALPAGAGGVANFQIRFYINAGNNDFFNYDYITITGDAPSVDCSYVGSGSCTAAPPGEVSDTTPYLTASKNASDPALVDLSFENLGAIAYNLYVSNAPDTHDFLVTSVADGKKECGLTVPASLTDPGDGTLALDGYALETGISGSTSALYFLISADNGAGSEGTLGTDSAALPRSADSYCAN